MTQKKGIVRKQTHQGDRLYGWIGSIDPASKASNQVAISKWIHVTSEPLSSSPYTAAAGNHPRRGLEPRT